MSGEGRSVREASDSWERFGIPIRHGEPMSGAHLRPADGEWCGYLHNGSVCNKCGFVSQHPRQGWQPIESAPRDGTEILLTDGHIRVIARWKEEAAFARCETDPGWEVNDNDEDCWYSFSMKPDEPTHWMPLPPAPGAGG